MGQPEPYQLGGGEQRASVLQRAGWAVHADAAAPAPMYVDESSVALFWKVWMGSFLDGGRGLPGLGQGRWELLMEWVGLW